MSGFALACSVEAAERGNDKRYRSFSRFTHPKSFSFMLDNLPDDVVGLCGIAKQQTIHHNLLTYYGVPNERWPVMARVWPPKMPDVLNALKNAEPHRLSPHRLPAQRIIGACMLESHFLAGLLRHKHIPTRIRAGYFKNIRTNGPHTVRFWETVAREKNRRSCNLPGCGASAQLLRADPEKWLAENNASTRRQNEIDQHTEHWLVEYWDEHAKQWRLLDANNIFLKAHSDIDVGFHLSQTYFEFAHEAWQQLRGDDGFNPEQYAEDPQDGRSHVRSQLLWDFFSVLNHDLAGYDEPSRDAWVFIKRRKYADLSAQELHELDALAGLLSRNPTVEELVAFYHQTTTLKIESVEKDPYSFLFNTSQSAAP